MIRWLSIVLAVLAGWAALFLVLFAVERPLLLLTVRFLGESLLPMARLALECVALAGAGWVTGRLSRPNPLITVLLLAATLTIWDFGGLLDIQTLWLLRLMADAFRDSRYWASLLDVGVMHVFLFGSLVAGAQLSRRRQAPLSIASPQ
jgi:hypothetical protein